MTEKPNNNRFSVTPLRQEELYHRTGTHLLSILQGQTASFLAFFCEWPSYRGICLKKRCKQPRKIIHISLRTPVVHFGTHSSHRYLHFFCHNNHIVLCTCPRMQLNVFKFIRWSVERKYFILLTVQNEKKMECRSNQWLQIRAKNITRHHLLAFSNG